jgi:hypothetical protein
MRAALVSRLKRLEAVRATEERDRPLKVEFAYLKQLPREYSGPRHIVSVSKRPDGRCEYEERPGEAPFNHVEDPDPNVMKIYFVRAPESGNENHLNAARAGGPLGLSAAPGVEADITS